MFRPLQFRRPAVIHDKNRRYCEYAAYKSARCQNGRFVKAEKRTFQTPSWLRLWSNLFTTRTDQLNCPLNAMNSA